MNRKRLLLIVLPVGVVVALLVVVLATSAPAINRRTRSPLVGKPAPDVSGQLLSGTGTYNLTYRSNRWTVVNFFASWCRECIDEHADFLKFSQSHLPDQVELVSVLFEDKSSDAQKFFADRGGNWPVVIDDGRLALDFGVAAVPETFVISPNGTVAVKFVGTITADGLDAVIRELGQESGALASTTAATP